MAHKRGELHHRAKVSDSTVQEMRRLRERHGLPFSAIGERFGVSKWTVRDICEYRTRI